MRVVLLPVLIIAFMLQWYCVAGGLFIVISLTDFLDGYLARKWNQTSDFGAFLDPVADKLAVATALLLILYASPTWYFLIMALLIISREITVSALREWMAQRQLRAAVAVSIWGKVKTATQMLALTLLLFWPQVGATAAGIPVFWISVVILAVSTFLAVLSMVQYMQAAVQAVQELQELQD